MILFILTGPAAAGKNTVASEFAKLRRKCVVIDVDLVRWMVLQPHKAPWDGEEGINQQELGVRNTCMLAKNFIKEGYDVIILDVISDKTANIYKKDLKAFNPKIILLLPTYKEMKRRNTLRPQRLQEKEIDMIYEWQKKLTVFDKKIDNTDPSAQEVANQLLALTLVCSE